MTGFFASGQAVAVVLAVLIAEFVLLVAWRRAPPLTVALALLPGALMLLALGAALVGADWRWVALPLTLSLPVHLADLVRRGLIGRRAGVYTDAGRR